MNKIVGSRVLVTGGAGFIGSNIVDVLEKSAERVVVYDNLSSGHYEFLKAFDGKKGFRFVKGDLLDSKLLDSVVKEEEPDIVVHLAANPDVRRGIKETSLDLKHGTLATYNVLESMRIHDVKSIIFSSSSVVYGEAKKKPTPEDYGPLLPISLYGSSKLASEGLISAFGSLFGIDTYIFRFANIVGRNQTHGAIVDFINKLRKNSRELVVLGNGKQRKSYMDVIDCVNAMLTIYKRGKSIVLNLATDGQTSVEFIAKSVIREMGLKSSIRYTGTVQGWPGDIANTWLSNSLMKKLGVKIKYNNSDDAVLNAIKVVTGQMLGGKWPESRAGKG